MKSFLTIITFWLIVEVMGFYVPGPITPQDKPGAVKNKIYFATDGDAVLGFLKKCRIDIKKGSKDGTPLSIHKYYMFMADIKKLAEYKWFEVDTEFSRKWIIKVYKVMGFMTRMKKFIVNARANGRMSEEKSQEALHKFSQAYDMLGKLLKKPERVDRKKYSQLKRTKKQWQKDMLKKLKMR
ncbi:hypothetical protein P0136_08565 [Lentisphaerota bacterium ZTH]|nr:hypothetical protein JYG24_00330 [Lentisphaerota bacterium]WET05417.1 hypothetical protein P0136_08565 [Lentisphaerota bacterium ZTH]